MVVRSKKDVKSVSLEVESRYKLFTVNVIAEKDFYTDMPNVEFHFTETFNAGAISVSCDYIMSANIDFTEEAIMNFAIGVLAVEGDELVEKYQSVVNKKKTRF